MEINQSLIKRLSKRYCPRKVKAEFDKLHKRVASEAMIKGQYFEWLLFGTKNREGQIPEIKLKKNGTKTVDQIRIESQVKKFPEILEKEGIEIFGTDRTFHVEMYGHVTFGTWDAYGLKWKRPTIIDIKLTGNIDNDFGAFCWGEFESMDKIQAEKYMEAGKRIDGIEYDFLFMVFDFKPKPDYRLYHVPYTPQVPLSVQSRMEETVAKIHYHEQNGWVPIGINDECKDCVFSDTCEKFTTKKDSKEKWFAKEKAKIENQKKKSESEEEFEKMIAEEFTL